MTVRSQYYFPPPSPSRTRIHHSAHQGLQRGVVGIHYTAITEILVDLHAFMTDPQ